MELTSQIIASPAVPKPNRVLWISLLAINLLFIAVIDRMTANLPVHHLYYLPIILAAIRFGKRGGMLVAFLSVILYHLANPNLLQASNTERDLLQLVIFIGVGLVTARLSSDAARMKYLAMTDDLTGLHNLRSFELHYARMLEDSITQHSPMSLLVIDLDHLKALNTRLGHLAGAQGIQLLGRIIAAHIPSDAIACRYGGDEFVIALSGCALSRARRIAETIRTTLLQTSPYLAGHQLQPGELTMSAGVASILPRNIEGRAAQGEALFRAADEALYQAKSDGRDRVYVDRPTWPALNCQPH